MVRGERSEEAWAWFSAVCEAVQEIPYGKVTSYAHIARLVGKRRQLLLQDKKYDSTDKPSVQHNVHGNIPCSRRRESCVLNTSPQAGRRRSQTPPLRLDRGQ